MQYDNFNPYIFNQISDGARVLDVGCATGLLGEKLRAKGRKNFLVGIEQDRTMAKKAKENYDKIIEMDLEITEDFPFEKEYFDIIVCADILEHLRRPEIVLKKLAQYLSRNGFFLISIPNVAFLSIRISLLLGNFNYQPSGGILDENHLRFFTRKSFVKLLEEAGLKANYIRGYNLVRPLFCFLKIFGALFPTLFSIQFLIKAKKSNP